MVIIINVFIYSCGCPVTVCRTRLASQTRGQRVLNVCYGRYSIYMYMSPSFPILILSPSRARVKLNAMAGKVQRKVFILKNNSSY